MSTRTHNQDDLNDANNALIFNIVLEESKGMFETSQAGTLRPAGVNSDFDFA